MRFIKIFGGINIPELEKRINEWIAQRKLEVVDIKYTPYRSGDYGVSHCVCVVYEADRPFG